MLSAKVDTNLNQVRKWFLKFRKKLPREVTKGLLRAGLQLKEIILDKTDRGFDKDGRKFTPYSKSYSDQKGKITVNLQDTNRMLQSITARPEGKNKVKLFFRSQREANKALFHQKGLGKLPERKFFGFSKANEKAIQREFAKFIKKQMKNFKIWVREKI